MDTSNLIGRLAKAAWRVVSTVASGSEQPQDHRRRDLASLGLDRDSQHVSAIFLYLVPNGRLTY